MIPKKYNTVYIVYFEIRFFTILSYILLSGCALREIKPNIEEKTDFKMDNRFSLLSLLILPTGN